MSATTISWTDHSINPIRARDKVTGKVGHYCEKISHGCTNCYASNLQKRFGLPQFPGARKLPLLPLIGENGRVSVNDQLDVFLDKSKLQEVISRQKPTKYFWCDMTDMFGAWVSVEWLDMCFATMALTPQHTHQILTKRPERMRDYLVSLVNGKRSLGNCLEPLGCEGLAGRLSIMLAYGVKNGDEGTPPWTPFKNVWVGVSVESQEQADVRIPILLQTPAVVRFLSVEPLLSPLNLRTGIYNFSMDCSYGRGTSLDGIHWVIIGGESGQKARPCHLEWIRSLVGQCKAAGTAVFCKQVGADPRVHHPKDPNDPKHWPGLCAPGIDASKGEKMEEWPEDLRIREFPKCVKA